MRIAGWLLLISTANLCGCVHGYGRCLFVSPFKTELRGTVHFRDYPRADRIDHVPVLVLDRTAYVYAPALSRSCQSADEVQLAPITDLPPDIADNAKVVVEGSLVEATRDRQHTNFVLNVQLIRLLDRKELTKP